MTKVTNESKKCAKCQAESQQIKIYSINSLLGSKEDNEKLRSHQQVCPKCKYTAPDISKIGKGFEKRYLNNIVRIFITLILLFIVFKNIPFKNNNLQAFYDFLHVKEGVSGKVELSLPLFSFDFTEKESNEVISISFKNMRSKWLLKKEIENHLSLYENIKCDENEYYYSANEGYTVISYDIKNYYLFNIINYKFTFGNYCE